MTQGYTNNVPIDTDGTLSANSDSLVPSQKAVVTYTAAELAVLDAAKLDKNPTTRTASGTTDTIVAGDDGNIVKYTNAATVTVTVPSGLGTGFGTILIQDGAGTVTMLASSTTIRNRFDHLEIAAQYTSASLLAYEADVLLFQGDTA